MHAIIRAGGFLALFLVPATALGDDCAKPDLLEAYPDSADIPPLVPSNATLTAHYAPTAQYLGEDVTLSTGASAPVTLSATFDETQGLLQVTPSGLVSNQEYTLHWPRLAGIGTASRGRGRDVTFTVSATADTVTPSFAGLDHVEWDVSRERDSCTDSLEDRFAFRLFPSAASDDFPSDFLSLYVFQTAGPRVDSTAAPSPVSIQRFPESGKDARLNLSIGDGAGHVCFAAFVKDLTGKPSAGAEHEVCTHTTKPPFFYGCRTSTPGIRSSALVPGCLSLLVLSILARRRHRLLP